MFVARAWRVRPRPMGTQCLCAGGIMVCGPIRYSPRQTFRTYGTVPRMLNGCYKHGVPTGRFPRSTIVLQTFRPAGTVSYVLRLCYKHSVPTGRSPDVERLLQTFRPYGTVPQALRLCYKRSVPLGRFPTFDDCATHLVPLGQVGCGSSFRAERKFWWLTSGVIR